MNTIAAAAVNSLSRGERVGVRAFALSIDRTPLHVWAADSAHADRRVEAGGHRPSTRTNGTEITPRCLAPRVSVVRPSFRLLSSTDDREHVPHARQGSVRTRDQGQV